MHRSETTSSISSGFSLGGFTVEPSLLRVSRGGKEVRLEAKVMQVLVCMVEHAGSVVTRTELEQRVWAGRVVTEDSLTAAIAKLRRAFDDDAHAPRMIETIPKSGYRLIAELVPVHAAAGDTGPSRGASALPRRRLLGPGAIRVVLPTVALLLAFGVWTLLEPDGLSRVRTKPLTDKTAVAVLPFENLGATPEQDYFANGITADLITDLSKLQTLSVIAPGSVFAYDSGPSAVRQIADDMELGYVVVGNVQRIDARLRINVQLIEANRESAVWGERYTGTMDDLFGLQDRISSEVIAALKVKLSPSEETFLANRPTANVLAYDYYLRGMQEHGGRSAIQNRAARDHFREAIELDPGFSQAYAGLAMTYSRDAIDGWTTQPGAPSSEPPNWRTGRRRWSRPRRRYTSPPDRSSCSFDATHMPSKRQNAQPRRSRTMWTPTPSRRGFSTARVNPPQP